VIVRLVTVSPSTHFGSTAVHQNAFDSRTVLLAAGSHGDYAPRRLDAPRSAVYASDAMDLFAASGIDLPHSGGRARGRAGAPRASRVPPFAAKVVEEARARQTPPSRRPSPSTQRRPIMRAGPKNPSAGSRKRPSVRSSFRSSSKRCSATRPLTLSRFTRWPSSGRSAAAPLTLRWGASMSAPGSMILSRRSRPRVRRPSIPMSGRGRSPVQQAWDYAVA